MTSCPLPQNKTIQTHNKHAQTDIYYGALNSSKIFNKNAAEFMVLDAQLSEEMARTMALFD